MGRWRRFAWLWLALAALLAYGRTARYEFVYDDYYQILQNPYVTKPGHLGEILFTHVWDFIEPKNLSNYYRPLHILSHRLVYALWGPDPGAFHLFNVLLHGINVLLVYRIGCRLWGPGAAFVGGLLFALHPGHTESVAWVAGVTDLLCTLFLLGASDLYVSSVPGQRVALAGSMGLFLCALLSKETALVWPALVVAYDLLLRRQEGRWNLCRWLAVVGTLGLYVGLRLHALGAFAPQQGRHFSVHSTEFVYSIAALFGKYWRKMLVPTGLNAFYPFQPYDRLNGAVAVSLAWILLLGVFVLWGWSRAPRATFGVLWVSLTLAPVLNINGIGENVFADRYVYLPSVAVCLALAVLWARWRDRSSSRWVPIAAVSVVCFLYGMQAVVRNEVWREEISLYRRTLEQNPDSVQMQALLGTAYFDRGRYPAAIQEFQRVVEKKPKFDSYNSLAGAYLANGQRREALEMYRKALQTDPGSTLTRARILELEGRPEEAMAEYRSFIRDHPAVWYPYNNLGELLIRQQRMGEAQQVLEEAAALQPDSPAVHFNLGIAYGSQGESQRALQEFQRVLELNPNSELARQQVLLLSSRRR
ncbi:MAG: tetratricopeptide repeat protein [Acidobacteria bacterium]|nr:tetratricopeptide repeat protein [Acidobacteriota bacterium]